LSDGRLLCGWHFWAFDADTGAHTHLPTVCLVRYPVRVTDGVVEVELEG
jgi:nitrite reductase/ring-hydroxylating ferredoxin subunit